MPRGRLQIEASASYAFEGRFEHDSHLVSFPTALRVGVWHGLELRAITSLLGIDANPIAGAGTVHPTDTSVGTKGQLLVNAGWTPDLALMVDVFLPSGGGPFTGRVVVPEARAASSWALPQNLGLLLNAGVDVPEGDAGRFVRVLYVANFSYALPWLDERLGVFVEAFGLIPAASEASAVVQIDAGAALLFGNDWQLDVFTQHGVSDAAPDFQIALGVSARTAPLRKSRDSASSRSPW